MLRVMSTKQGMATRAWRGLPKTKGEATEHHPPPRWPPVFAPFLDGHLSKIRVADLCQPPPPSLGEATVLGPEALSCPAALPGWGFRLASYGITQRTRASGLGFENLRAAGHAADQNNTPTHGTQTEAPREPGHPCWTADCPLCREAPPNPIHSPLMGSRTRNPTICGFQIFLAGT